MTADDLISPAFCELQRTLDEGYLRCGLSISVAGEMKEVDVGDVWRRPQIRGLGLTW